MTINHDLVPHFLKTLSDNAIHLASDSIQKHLEGWSKAISGHVPTRPSVQFIDGPISEAFSDSSTFRYAVVYGSGKRLIYCWSIGLPDPKIKAHEFNIIHRHQNLCFKQMLSYVQRKSVYSKDADYNFVRVYCTTDKLIEEALKELMLSFAEQACYSISVGPVDTSDNLTVDVTFGYDLAPSKVINKQEE